MSDAVDDSPKDKGGEGEKKGEEGVMEWENEGKDEKNKGLFATRCFRNKPTLVCETFSFIRRHVPCNNAT